MKTKRLFVLSLGLVLLTLLVSTAWAHTLFMTVTDNDDGSVTIEGMYSTGGVAAVTPVRLMGPRDKILLKGLTDDGGEFTFKKPDTPYRIILDAGPGHTAEENGPR